MMISALKSWNLIKVSTLLTPSVYFTSQMPLRMNFSRLTHIYGHSNDFQHKNKSTSLRDYTLKKQAEERKLSKQDYLIFKQNLNSIENVSILVQYLQPLIKSLNDINSRQTRRVLKLLLKAESNMLESSGSDAPLLSKRTLLHQNSISQRITALKKYSEQSDEVKKILLNNKEQSVAVNQFFLLKEQVCSHLIKKMHFQQVVLGSFKTIAYLSIPTVLYFAPYLSLVFLHPYVGGTYYLFALHSLRQHSITGIFISILLAGSLSFAFFRTYSDVFALYSLKFSS